MSLLRKTLSDRTGRTTADGLYDRANHLAAGGEAAAAMAHYRRAVAHRPAFPEAYNNLGNLLRADGRIDEAVAAYRAALRVEAGHPLLHYNLGSALKQAGRTDEAGLGFRRALALLPDHAEAHNNHANLLRARGAPDRAAAGYRRALAVRPDWDEAHDNLAAVLYLLHEAGETGEAGRLAGLWLRDHPGHPVARHIGTALAGGAGDTRASDAYVRQVFDHFAADFDARLGELGYRAPALLGGALATAFAAAGMVADGGCDVLDAGCGTGLCAVHLRPYARTLTGVDLSAGMLERARDRGYDALVEAELEGFLLGRKHGFDLIAAADVLCYFGALDAVLAAAAVALRPGGWLAFTVERLAEGAEPHRLQPHGRYAHGEAHVRAALAAAGLAVRGLVPDILRHESGEPVGGLVVTARRPD